MLYKLSVNTFVRNYIIFFSCNNLLLNKTTISKLYVLHAWKFFLLLIKDKFLKLWEKTDSQRHFYLDCKKIPCVSKCIVFTSVQPNMCPDKCIFYVLIFISFLPVQPLQLKLNNQYVGKLSMLSSFHGCISIKCH